ncbi:unnamed protein product [Staurois parvus]|uniref:Uncharacterized protein n=1 Tax=Staurois parvus TaxID=386267 RepID=A0ABN9DCP9_9NEOB|nr:unnamed protein product [Staurois parvus]
MGPLCPIPNKKAYEKGTRGISWSPLLTPSFQMKPSIPLLGIEMSEGNMATTGAD